MKVFISSVSALALAGCSSMFSTAPHPSHEVFKIEQSYAQNLHQSTKGLAISYTETCGTDEAALKKAWGDVAHSWMMLQAQQRGPEEAIAQSWNMQYWPDKKNTTGRKMRALLAESTSWTSSDISNQSVAVQGIGAIEWLLYDEESQAIKNNEKCALGAAISGNLVTTSEQIQQAWQDNPWTSLDEEAWHKEYLALMTNQLDYALSKMKRPLAKIGQPRAHFAEAWRSETSYENLEYNIRSLEKLYFAKGQGLDAILRNQGHVALADDIKQQFSDVLEAWPSNRSLFETIQTKEGYRDALNNYNRLNHLRYKLSEESAIKLGIILGFNSTDGD
ncbi:imelysin family protein [Vibrio sp.]|nr:imelysin family protein [Vibrio sp.]